MQHTNMRAGAFPPIFPKHGARSTELAGFGAGLGLGSQPVMSECVSSDAFTFIAFVNYSHKDIKCKLWNRRHTRAPQIQYPLDAKRQRASLSLPPTWGTERNSGNPSWKLNWKLFYTKLGSKEFLSFFPSALANYSTPAYDCHMQNVNRDSRFPIPASGSCPPIWFPWMPFAGRTSGPHPTLQSIVGNAIWPLDWLCPPWLPHLTAARDQKLILLKPRGLSGESTLFIRFPLPDYTLPPEEDTLDTRTKLRKKLNFEWQISPACNAV